VIVPLPEDVIVPRIATRHYPRDELGRKVHVPTAYQHMTIGVRGVVLQFIRKPKLWTSKRSLGFF
jgi:hypothetical protein